MEPAKAMVAGPQSQRHVQAAATVVGMKEMAKSRGAARESMPIARPG